MFSKQTISEIAAVAGARRLDPAALLAIAEVESAGVAYADIDGRREPIIRFEGHYFDAGLSGAIRERARLLGLAHPKPGRIANPQTQAGRWRLLARAAEIDQTAAWEATSWGLGQVMGAHWKRLGFASVDEFVHEARAGAAGQARLMASYIAAFGLERALARRDWKAVARAYNGPAFAKNGYDRRLETAYQRYSAMFGRSASGDLRLGNAGRRVENLQAALNARGAQLIIDGLFGRATYTALKIFQRRNGLIADGVAGPSTLRALAQSVPPENQARPVGLLARARDFMWRRA